MRVLMSAYACEPRRGSEPGAGWLWACAAAAAHDVTVLTRASRREAFRPDDSPERLTLVFVDVPAPVVWVVRSHERLYYVLWQVVAGLAARRMHHAAPFDVVHHVTFANAWLPALARWARAPFVLGPVGGGPTVPRELRAELDWPGRLFELLRRAGRIAGTYNPLVRSGWRQARMILAQNDETMSRLPTSIRHKTVVRWNSVVGPDLERLVTHSAGGSEDGPIALVAGRLLLWKGGTLAIRALRSTGLPWRLDIVGAGKAESDLRALVDDLGLAHRVTFTPWVPREELWRRMRGATAVLVPSLRDDAPLVVAEAQALGVPVVALDQGGPAVMAKAPGASITLVPVGSADATARDLATALDEVARANRAKPCDAFGLPALEAFVTGLYDQATA